MKKSLFLLSLFVGAASALQLPSSNPERSPMTSSSMDRRSLLGGVAATGFLWGMPTVAQAGIDPALLKSLPVQGDESGAAQRLRQVESIQRPETDLVDIPFTELPSGVSFREYREGKGEAGKEMNRKNGIQFLLAHPLFSP